MRRLSDHTGIAVIESKWFPKSNVSVRGLFDLVADLATGSPHAYHYEMASSEAALKEAIPRIAKDRSCRYLCLAMHGSEKGLHLINEERVTRTELRNMLERIKSTPGAKLSGIHLASCLFGTHEIAAKLFDTKTDVAWIAGYSQEVDWIRSSALDLLFFNHFANLRHERLTEIQKIHAVVGMLRQTAAGLMTELGFGVYVRKQKTGGAKNLVEEIQA